MRLRPVPLNDILLHEYSLSIQKLNNSQPGEDLKRDHQVLFKRGSALAAPGRKLELKAVPFDLRITLFEDGTAIEVHRITGVPAAHTSAIAGSGAPNILIPVELVGGVVGIGRVEAMIQVMGKPKADPKTKMTIAPKKEKKKIGLVDSVEYERPAPMSRRHLLEARKRFKELKEKDRVAKKGAAARNALEAYVYDSRDKLASPEAAAVHGEERLGELRTLLDEAQSWLQERGDGANAQAYLARLNALKREVDPVLKEATQQSVHDVHATLERHSTKESAKQRAARIARKNEARAKRDGREL